MGVCVYVFNSIPHENISGFEKGCGNGTLAGS